MATGGAEGPGPSAVIPFINKICEKECVETIFIKHLEGVMCTLFPLQLAGGADAVISK